MNDFCAFVSCDLVAHSLENETIQLSRIQAINEIVSHTIDRCGHSNAIWASSGDGGHVMLTGQHWAKESLSLILTLSQWSSQNAPLRISAHYGKLITLKGADGRTQVVGDAINMCGSIITFGSEFGVVVSDAYRSEIEKFGPENVKFKEARAVYLKHFSAQLLSLMSVDSQLVSKWGPNIGSEHRMLEEALIQVNESKSKKLYWPIIYHAKRLLQLNPADKLAIDSLLSIQPSDLGNPFLGKMDKSTFCDFIKLAQLISREDTEVICQHDDEGDAMFIVLTGEVGIVSRNPNDFFNARIGAGEIVGELALYLKRNRTATMQAVGNTSLLSFNYDNLQELIAKQGNEINPGIENFFVNRVLEHLCNHASYLRQSFENEQKMPWDLIKGTEIITLDWKNTGDLPPNADSKHYAFFQREGLYILARGLLTKQITEKPVKLIGEELPIVYVDFPGHFVYTDHRYAIDETAILVFIPVKALQTFGADCFRRLVNNIKQSIPDQFYYDVFISYNHLDKDIANRWKSGFEEAGLRVYLNTLVPMNQFEPQIEDAIRNALVLVAFISSHAIPSAPYKSWVGKEIDYRKSVFDEAHANILPIKLTGGQIETIGEGYSAINAIGREDEAFQEALNSVKNVQNAKDTYIPLALKRSTDAKL